MKYLRLQGSSNFICCSTDNSRRELSSGVFLGSWARPKTAPGATHRPGLWHRPQSRVTCVRGKHLSLCLWGRGWQHYSSTSCQPYSPHISVSHASRSRRSSEITPRIHRFWGSESGQLHLRSPLETIDSKNHGRRRRQRQKPEHEARSVKLFREIVTFT